MSDGRYTGIDIQWPKVHALLSDPQVQLGNIQPGFEKELTTQFKSAESVLERSHCSIDRFVQINQCSVYDEENDRRLG